MWVQILIPMCMSCNCIHCIKTFYLFHRSQRLNDVSERRYRLFPEHQPLANMKTPTYFWDDNLAQLWRIRERSTYFWDDKIMNDRRRC